MGTSGEQQLLQQRFAELSAAVQCSNSLEWAVLHGDSDQAYQAMHESATALLEAPATPREPPAKAEGGTAASGETAGETATADGLTVLAGLLASKTKEWRTRIVLCAIHLLERDQRWDDALHYLEILLGITYNGGNDTQEQQQPQGWSEEAAGGSSHTRVAAHQRGSVPAPANVMNDRPFFVRSEQCSIPIELN
eukprot:COSAG06_NODE_1069_length_10828_cov_22.835493_7_plen_194_part_00